jgi:hypothetical protein
MQVILYIYMYIYMYKYIYMYINTHTYIYMVPPTPKTHQFSEFGGIYMFFTQVLLKLQNLGHFSRVKQMHFLETCCNPTLPILHRMQASRSRKTSWIQGGRIQDSRSRKRRLDPRSLFASNLESWIQRDWINEACSEGWILNPGP